MTVVKSQHASPMMHDAVVLDLGDLAGQARQMLDRAHAEAEAIVVAARAEAARQAKQIADEAREQGQQEGFEQGRCEGRDQARADVIDELRPCLEELERSWTAALQEWNEARGDMLLSAREDVLRLAITLAEKITLRRFEQDPTLVRAQVEATLALLSDQSTPTVVVHPADLELVREVVPALEAALGEGAHLVLREDGSMSRGGCRVLSQRGEIDATIDMQLERIAEALLPDRNMNAAASAVELEVES